MFWKYLMYLLISYSLLCISGCSTNWDELWCWYRAEVGQVVNVSCSEVSQLFAPNHGKLLLSQAATLILFYYYLVWLLPNVNEKHNFRWTKLIFKTECHFKPLPKIMHVSCQIIPFWLVSCVHSSTANSLYWHINPGQ